ncbi:MAG: hypothetical protein VXY93_11605, partial [Pseudomonadota bacterium]|nr:hypothetical protein [Pseudomonadota bacterium]
MDRNVSLVSHHLSGTIHQDRRHAMFGVQDGRRANPDMTEPDTEARVAQSQWLDSLDDSEALRVML